MDCITWLVSYAVSVEFEEICENSSAGPIGDSQGDSMVIDDEAVVTEIAVPCDVDSIGSLLGLSRQEGERDPGSAE